MMKKNIILILGLSLILASCSSDKGNGGPGSSAPPPADSPKGDGMTTSYFEGTYKPYFRKMIIKGTHGSQVNVSLASIGWCQIIEKTPNTAKSIPCTFHEILQLNQGDQSYYLKRQLTGKYRKASDTEWFPEFDFSTWKQTPNLAKGLSTLSTSNDDWKKALAETKDLPQQEANTWTHLVPMTQVKDAHVLTHKWATERCRFHPQWKEFRENDARSEGNHLLFNQYVSYFDVVTRQTFTLLETDIFQEQVISLPTLKLKQPNSPRSVAWEEISSLDSLEYTTEKPEDVPEALNPQRMINFAEFNRYCDMAYNSLDPEDDSTREKNLNLYFPYYDAEKDKQLSQKMVEIAKFPHGVSRIRLFSRTSMSGPFAQALKWHKAIPTLENLKNNPKIYQDFIRAYGRKALENP